ncbi:Fc.00g032140.m01.CDS01 [Cosmosporella sp. VM-42]
MAARSKTAEMPLIFIDGMSKTEPSKRKLIRKYVMLGKNRGKTRSVKLIDAATPCNSESSNGEQDEAAGLLIKMRYSKLPNKVGSELSFTQFAAAVEPSLIHDVLKFSFIAKKVMYPLESCIVFHRKTKIDTSWFELLASDAAYMHAAVFALQGYIFYASGRSTPVTARSAMAHYSAALRLLRERVSVPSKLDNVWDPTVLAVLYLASYAHFMNDYDTAKHHMEGLGKIVSIRGGLTAFSYNTKLVMELLKCDLGIALNNGTMPTFFNGLSSEPLMPYNLSALAAEEIEHSAAKIYWKSVELGTNEDLVQAWAFLTRFCSTINSAAQRKRQLPKETLLNAMASSMYRLLRMNSFDTTSIDEAIRLGLLAFSSHIFLSWQDVKLPHTYLPEAYRGCLLNLKLPDTLPSQVLLWLLMIGYISIFTPADDPWLMPWVRVNIELCEAHSWSDLRGQLEAFPWIDILHDKPGRAAFDAAILSQLGGGWNRDVGGARKQGDQVRPPI